MGAEGTLNSQKFGGSEKGTEGEIYHYLTTPSDLET